MLIVLSDGEPLGGEGHHGVVQWHLGEVVRKVTGAGIEVYGVGICSRAVERYYNAANGSAHVVVNEIGELAVQLIRLLSGRLMVGGRKAA